MAGSGPLRATSSVLKNMSYVLNVKDVISDAHNTFIGGVDAEDLREQEFQRELEDILKRDRAFNWSDDEDNTVAAQSQSQMLKNSSLEL